MIANLPLLFPPDRKIGDLVLRVEEANGRSERGQFVSVLHRLYRGDRRWVPPLSSARRQALHPKHNTLLAGASLGAFVGIAQNLGLGDEPVGSIAAWFAPPGDEFGESLGSWGLFESINAEEMAERLISEAETWLFEHAGGLAAIAGPMTLEPLASPGLLTNGFDQSPAAFLPYNPPYYPEMIEAQGYEPRMTWSAYLVETGRSEPGRQVITPRVWRRILGAYSQHEQGPVDRRSLVPGLAGWLGNLAGERPATATMDWRWATNSAARRAVWVLDESSGGEAACFAIPDLAPALRVVQGRPLPLRWPLFALALQRTRRLRVFPAVAPEVWGPERLSELYRELMLRAAQQGYRQMMVAPVPDDDERSVQALVRLHALPVQQFTIYEKKFW